MNTTDDYDGIINCTQNIDDENDTTIIILKLVHLSNISSV